MSGRNVETGSTDQSIVVWAFDSDGVAVEVTPASGGLSAAYRIDTDGREGTPVTMTLVARTTPGVHRDSAITYKGAGKHEIDLPDAAIAAGEVSVELAATGVASVYVEKLDVSNTTVSVVVPSSVAAASAEVNTITAVRGDTLRRSFEDLGNISTRTKLWLTIKRHESDADADAILQITELGGLITFNGAAASSSALGSITVDDATAGDITIFVDETITSQFGLWQGYVFDVQWRGATDVTTPLTGVFNVTADVTKATS